VPWPGGRGGEALLVRAEDKGAGGPGAVSAEGRVNLRPSAGHYQLVAWARLGLMVQGHVESLRQQSL
jgi:hypothetical protein